MTPVFNPTGTSAGLKQLVNNPNALNFLRSYKGRATNGRMDIAANGNSVSAGIGGSGDGAAVQAGYAGTILSSGQVITYANSDNNLGWVGRLRNSLAIKTGIAPGEGYVFCNDPRFSLNSGAAIYAGVGVQAIGLNLSGSQTLSLNSTSMSGGWNNSYFDTTNYIGIIIWDNGSAIPVVTVAGSGVTLYTRPGGNVPYTNTNDGTFKPAYFAAPTTGQSMVISVSSGTSYIAGFDFVNNPNGVHIHNMSISGAVTANLCGGQTATNAAYRSVSQVDRIIRSSYEWLSIRPVRTIIGTLLANGQITATTGYFDTSDVGTATITGTGIPFGTTIQEFASSTVVVADRALTAGSGITVTLTYPKTPALHIMAHNELNDYTNQGPAGNVTGTISGVTGTTGILTLSGGQLFVSTDPGNVTLTGTGITGSASITSVSGDGTYANISGTLSNGGPYTYTRVPTTGYGGNPTGYSNTPATTSGWITSFLLNGYNSGSGTNGVGPLAVGNFALILSGPRRYPDGTPNNPNYMQSSYISANQSLCNNLQISQYFSQVAGFDISQVWGSTASAQTLNLQNVNSAHPTPVGHVDIAYQIEELFDNPLVWGGVTTTVPA